METNETPPNELIISNESKHHLLQISKWGVFLAVIGYIGIGLIVIVGLVMMVGFGRSNMFGMAPETTWLSVVYLIIVIIYFFPVRYLHRFCLDIKHAIEHNQQQSVDDGFRNLKSLFKFMGIFTIVMVSIYLIAFAISMMVFAIR